MRICAKCGNNYPTWAVIEGKKRNLSSRKMCLSCSPFGNHNTRTVDNYINKGSNSYYCKCGETESSQFTYGRTDRCNFCHNEKRIDRFKANREFILEYLGGKCVACGYDKYKAALDVHHKDPSIKDPNFSHIRGWSRGRIIKEIENCIILCGNCHAGLHNGEIPDTELYFL